MHRQPTLRRERRRRRLALDHESYPADAVSLRSVSSDNFVIVDTTEETRVIEKPISRAGDAHPKAIYIVPKPSSIGGKLDTGGAGMRPRADANCAPTPSRTRVTPIDEFAREGDRTNGRCTSSRASSVQKIKFYTNENAVGARPASGRCTPPRTG